MPTPSSNPPEGAPQIPHPPNIIDGAVEGFDAWYAWARRHDPVLKSAASIAQASQLSKEDEVKFAVYFTAMSANNARTVIYNVVERLGSEAVFGQ